MPCNMKHAHHVSRFPKIVKPYYKLNSSFVTTTIRENVLHMYEPNLATTDLDPKVSMSGKVTWKTCQHTAVIEHVPCGRNSRCVKQLLHYVT